LYYINRLHYDNLRNALEPRNLKGMNMNIKFLIVVSAIASAVAFPALAEDQFAETRAQLAAVVTHCSEGATQRACISDLRTADTALYDFIHPPRDEKDRAFRACTKDKAIELETQFIVDLMQLQENQWAKRFAVMQNDVQANWISCIPKR